MVSSTRKRILTITLYFAKNLILVQCFVLKRILNGKTVLVKGRIQVTSSVHDWKEAIRKELFDPLKQQISKKLGTCIFIRNKALHFSSGCPILTLNVSPCPTRQSENSILSHLGETKQALLNLDSSWGRLMQNEACAYVDSQSYKLFPKIAPKAFKNIIRYQYWKY